MMSEDTLVSVVIPVHNGDRFIGRTLASALAQTYAPLEIVVVDDGSTDHTASLVEDVAARDNRIRLFRTQKSGVAAARNFGIGQARGNLIALLDADDLWHPEKIARQVEVMRASSAEVGLVYCWEVDIDEDDFVVPSFFGEKPAYQGRVTEELAIRCFIDSSSSILIKRSYIEAVGGYDVELQPQGAEDWKLYLVLSEVCEFAVVPEYLVGYRQTTGSLSRGITRMAQSTEIVARWLTEKWPDLPEETARLRTLNTNFFYARMALESNHFFKALCYRAKACRARQSLTRSDLEFVARLLFRMTGLRRILIRRHGQTLRPSLPFREVQATKKLQTGC